MEMYFAGVLIFLLGIWVGAGWSAAELRRSDHKLQELMRKVDKLLDAINAAQERALK